MYCKILCILEEDKNYVEGKIINGAGYGVFRNMEELNIQICLTRILNTNCIRKKALLYVFIG